MDSKIQEISDLPINSKLIAVDCTEQACSVALSDGKTLFQLIESTPKKHSELILPMINALMSRAGLTLSAIDGIALARGPGSFTGLRIATGVVQGLAYGADLPVLMVSSLVSLAHGFVRQNPDLMKQGCINVFAALDARMGEIYGACVAIDGIGKAKIIGKERVCVPEAVAGQFGDLKDDWFGVGSGWLYESVLIDQLFSCKTSRLREVRVPMLVQAQDVLLLAQTQMACGEAVAAEKVAPTYLRDTVTWKKLPGR